MEGQIFTLQDFMYTTKSITYLMIKFSWPSGRPLPRRKRT